MTDRVHPAAAGTEVHAAVRWVFANAAARNAINVGTPFADDVGCFAWQTDSNTIWLAISAGTGSTHWVQVGAAAAGTIVGPGSSTDFALVTWNGTTGVTLRNGVLLHPSSGSDPTVDLHITKKLYVDTRVRTARPKLVTNGISPYTLLDADEQILVDTSGGAVTLVLPAIAGLRMFMIKDIGGVSGGANKITLQPPATKKIEGVAANKIIGANFSGWCVSAGTDNASASDGYWVWGQL